jgi:hypothetical protein
MGKIVLTLSLIAMSGISIAAQVQVRFERNANSIANSDFRFQHVPPPWGSQEAARIVLVDGRLDPNGADLNALIDGRMPADEDDPGGNVFFNTGSFGGRIRMDFDRVFEIQEINTYSWHSNSRGPQLYKLYGSDGKDPNFNIAPKRGTDPITCGWKFIATVSTIPDSGNEGGQYGVSVRDARGTLGSYRYLLFDIYPSEIVDNWGNTFYGEMAVRTRQ